jgi:pilus assembly protein CpaE
MNIKWLSSVIDQNLIAEIQSALSQNGRHLDCYKSLEELEDKLPNKEDVLLVLPSNPAYDVYELCERISFLFPLVSIVLLEAKDQMDWKRAMQAKAIDLLEWPISVDSFVQTIEDLEKRIVTRLIKLQPYNKAHKDGKVITVVSTKGGVGKTTTSVNLAAAFGLQGKRVVLVDLDLQFGDVAISFNAKPKKTIYEWVKQEYENENSGLQDYLISVTENVAILAAPLRPELAESIEGEHVSQLIAELKQAYDLIIIDTPPLLVETVLVALDLSDEILLITALDLPTLKNSKICVETFDLLKLKEKIKVIINKDSQIGGLMAKNVEQVLNMPVYARIPSDFKTAVFSLNSGVPFVLSHAKSPLAKQVTALAKKLNGIDPLEEKQRKFWGRWFKTS